VTEADPAAEAFRALAEGRWDEARTAFEEALGDRETAHVRFGLGTALWWLGENRASVEQCSRAYALFRAAADVEGSVQCAVWLAITYKANFANFVAANGWLGRAERLLEGAETGPLHAWVWIARAYRMADLGRAHELAERALTIARDVADVDLELVAMSQLGLVRVGRGDVDAGFALIDEAVAAALAGERSNLDTVVYACCDMLNACELAGDLERATQWCKVADEFTATYGCPFLYAECRIYYGSVLAAKGRWEEAERELDTGRRMTAEICPGLHTRATARLAGLRVLQGRIEEAEQLLTGLGHAVDVESDVAVLTAAVALARGDASGAGRLLHQRLRRLAQHRWRLAAALDVLVDASITAGRLDEAGVAAKRLRDAAAAGRSRHLDALAASAAGRVALARGERADAIAGLDVALDAWSTLDRPFEVARTRFDLARALADVEPETAIDHARHALAAFEDLGATLDADRVAAFLRRQGVVPRVGAKGVGVLTAREREVLHLIGEGLSNPEIAARLHVSRKTAAHHVSHILTKLGLRNRAEAAARADAVLGSTPPIG
jgi:ATP/maltotriose-dependent transcriptional regulator MalT